MLTAVIFLLILLSAVTIHELAHYINAKSVGLPVRTFSVGVGPVLLRRIWHNTEWRLSLFPIGGYVDLPGMAPTSDDQGKLQHPTNGMAIKSLPEKLWVLSGGVIANFFLGVILICIVIIISPSYRQITANVIPFETGALISSVLPESAADSFGLKPLDTIISINNISNPNRDIVVREIQNSNKLDFLLLREGATVNLSLPWPPNDSRATPVLGVHLAPLTVEHTIIGTFEAIGEAFWFSVKLLPKMVHGFAKGLATTLTGKRSDEIAGPVGIISLVNQAAQIGLAPVLFLAAVINLSLAIFNLFPIPGLDGGRMLLATVTSLRGKPFRLGQEETIHFFGVFAVLALIVLITLNEISGLFNP